MRTPDRSRRRRLAALALLAAALALPASAAAGSHPGRTAKRRGGIVVHGRWTITVRDPDGRLVSRHRFENSYYGGVFLPNILDRQVSVGYWDVLLLGGPCTVKPNCAVFESGAGGASSTATPLTVTVSSKASGWDLVLSGSLNAPGTGTIDEAETGNGLCARSVAPETPCAPKGYFGFTRKTGLSVQVSSGQQIAVTVDISFS